MAGAAVGTSKEDIVRAKSLIDNGCDLIVIDTAHGHSKKVLVLMLYKLKKNNNKTPLCVGNIATAEAAKKLYNSGADIIKVGIGPGSICTTRMVAGIGVPQISAIVEVKKALKNKKIKNYFRWWNKIFWRYSKSFSCWSRCYNDGLNICWNT